MNTRKRAGERAPSGLSAISSTSSERDFLSIACEVVSIVASNLRSGYSGSWSVAFMPSFNSAEYDFGART